MLVGVRTTAASASRKAATEPCCVGRANRSHRGRVWAPGGGEMGRDDEVSRRRTRGTSRQPEIGRGPPGRSVPDLVEAVNMREDRCHERVKEVTPRTEEGRSGWRRNMALALVRLVGQNTSG